MAELHVTEITSIGAVEAGDNPEATIMLYKQRGHDQQDTTSADKSVKDRSKEMSIWDELGLDEDAVVKAEAHIAELVEKAVAEAREAIKKAKEDEEPDPLAKADPAVKEMIEKRDREIRELQDAVAKSVQAQRTAEYAEIAKQLAPVVGKPDEAAGHLDALQKGAPEAFGWLKGQLEKVKNVVVESNLLKELGTSDDSEGADVQDVVAKKVAEVRKSNPDLTEAAARAMVWRENPELVEAAREGK